MKRIVIFENHSGSSNKFYTIIFISTTEFHANYGSEGGGWTKTKTYFSSDFQNVYTTRINHGYSLVKDDYIDEQKYLEYRKKIELLIKKYNGFSDGLISKIWRYLLKHGTLTPDLMTDANTLYKRD